MNYYFVAIPLLFCRNTIIILSQYHYYFVAIPLLFCRNTIIILSQYHYYFVAIEPRNPFVYRSFHPPQIKL